MKKIFNVFALFFSGLVIFTACQETNYPGATLSPTISIFDVRSLYKGSEVTLTTSNMKGCSQLTAMVVSDHSDNNLPEGYIMLQEKRRLNKLRGISVYLGDEAKNFTIGDSIIVKLENKKLTRVNGLTQILGVNSDDITTVSRGNEIALNLVYSGNIVKNPYDFEGTRVALVKGFVEEGLESNPNTIAAKQITTLADANLKPISDGFGTVLVSSKNAYPLIGNYIGVVLVKEDENKNLTPQINVLRQTDIMVLKEDSPSATEPILLISGVASDVKGSDTNYEYIQFLATGDIDFSKTPFSVVVSNNAGTSTPTGIPTNGWATGGLRTYKINITSGKVAKGKYCYVGGAYKLINGPSSTSTATTANWVANYDYNAKDGQDFGTKKSGLMANSGNSWGIAVFKGTTVNKESTPVDVVMCNTGGTLFSAGPPAAGYKICDTDYYDIKNPLTGELQPFYRNGTNMTQVFKYQTADVGYFHQFGGQYYPKVAKWTKVREQKDIEMDKTSTIELIENEQSTKLRE